MSIANPSGAAAGYKHWICAPVEVQDINLCSRWPQLSSSRVLLTASRPSLRGKLKQLTDKFDFFVSAANRASCLYAHIGI